MAADASAYSSVRIEGSHHEVHRAMFQATGSGVEAQLRWMDGVIDLISLHLDWRRRRINLVFLFLPGGSGTGRARIHFQHGLADRYDARFKHKLARLWSIVLHGGESEACGGISR